ncbi:hypothetical protein HMPREF9171_1450 [Streptococcus agalactiae ATCC 13813]|uniref:Uncharacterized protein n=1 Tax=Streptococcus suis TaxID=1307 RepID=A0A8A8VS24_STRSU|nr:hypothetical protein HMPREF9171_1450 [Streptococcus agalactiae ATCC 13813]QIH56144.1 hypothetical protein GM_000060 [Streptococcus suis]QTQ40975.1 hypothetical protein YS64GM000053 [Streptococcus suis]
MSILLSFQDSIVHDILKISDFFSSFIGQLSFYLIVQSISINISCILNKKFVHSL